jgi:sigma-B regulation protein RsbU (phosphoserine phosphatase)
MSYTILVADDVRMNRKLLIDILNKKIENLEFLEAANGIEVVDLLKGHEVDLIILDLIMPVMDGYKVLKYLKTNTSFGDIPIIVNSAISEIHSVEETLRMGATDYFTKPLSEDDMEIILPLKVKNSIQMYEQQKTIKRYNEMTVNEIENATEFQKVMLPKSKNFTYVDLFIKFEPCIGIGGDFFDCVEVDGRTWFMIADVTGHGIAASMASSMVKILFRTSLQHGEMTPGSVLTHINNNIFEFMDYTGMLVNNYTTFTGFVGCIYKDILTFSNAGQPYPVLYRADLEKTIVLEESGPLVGAFENITFEEHAMTIHTNDTLLLYTDGIFCNGKKSDFSNWPIVHDYLEKNSEKLKEGEESFLENMYWFFHMLVNQHEEDTFEDDVALMLIKKK